MSIQTIILNNETYTYDDNSKKKIGGGGGGQVFYGKDDKNNTIAVKEINSSTLFTDKEPREIIITKNFINKKYSNIVPIIDAGQDKVSSKYFIVMPVCTDTLSAYINKISVPLSEAIEILKQILNGLKEVEHLNHRDLKPSNILFHDGAWKIADFGISKEHEHDVSTNTYINYKTLEYAAPEQWNSEEGEPHKIDIYALGCIFFAMMNKKPPFQGDATQLKSHHLHTDISTIPLPQNCNNIKSTIYAMLRKSGESRPSLDRLIQIFTSQALTNIQKPDISEIINQISIEKSAIDSQLNKQNTLLSKFKQIGQDGNDSFNQLYKHIYEHLSSLSIDVECKNNELKWGRGTFKISQNIEYFSAIALNNEFIPVCSTIISVSCDEYVWSASLIYLKTKDSDEFRWYETAFCMTLSANPNNVPYGLTSRKIPLTLFTRSGGMQSQQFAYNPIPVLPIDAENEGEFITRWTKLFSKAAIGNLNRPSPVPVNLNYI